MIGKQNKATSKPPQVKECTCTNAAQDSFYGIARRLMNWAPGAFNKTGGWRCTTCGRLHG